MRIQKTANRNLTGKGNASLLRQKRSRKPAFVAVKAANAMRNIVAAHRFRAASFAGVLCAKRAAKSRWTDQKMNEFIFWLAFGFSSARKLSSRRSSFRRILFVFVSKMVRPLRSRRRILLVQGYRGRRGPYRFPLANFCLLLSSPLANPPCLLYNFGKSKQKRCL